MNRILKRKEKKSKIKKVKLTNLTIQNCADDFFNFHELNIHKRNNV